MPREFTKEEVREKFLREVNALVDYWQNESRFPGIREKLQGLAFSIMSTIDGSSMNLPAFILAPQPAEEDKGFFIENGQDYFPENNATNVNCDIAGELHELLSKYRP